MTHVFLSTKDLNRPLSPVELASFSPLHDKLKHIDPMNVADVSAAYCSAIDINEIEVGQFNPVFISACLQSAAVTGDTARIEHLLTLCSDEALNSVYFSWLSDMYSTYMEYEGLLFRISYETTLTLLSHFARSMGRFYEHIENKRWTPYAEFLKRVVLHGSKRKDDVAGVVSFLLSEKAHFKSNLQDKERIAIANLLLTVNIEAHDEVAPHLLSIKEQSDPDRFEANIRELWVGYMSDETIDKLKPYAPDLSYFHYTYTYGMLSNWFNDVDGTSIELDGHVVTDPRISDLQTHPMVLVDWTSAYRRNPQVQDKHKAELFYLAVLNEAVIYHNLMGLFDESYHGSGSDTRWGSETPLSVLSTPVAFPEEYAGAVSRFITEANHWKTHTHEPVDADKEQSYFSYSAFKINRVAKSLHWTGVLLSRDEDAQQQLLDIEAWSKSLMLSVMTELSEPFLAVIAERQRKSNVITTL